MVAWCVLAQQRGSLEGDPSVKTVNSGVVPADHLICT
jgi:hypothetical protein